MYNRTIRLIIYKSVPVMAILYHNKERVILPEDWNTLPSSVTSVSNLESFKRLLTNK